MNRRFKVYCETSYWSYLTGRSTADEKIARWQCITQQWQQQEYPLCDLFVSDYVVQEARLCNIEQVALRMAARDGVPKLAANPDAVVPIAE